MSVKEKAESKQLSEKKKTKILSSESLVKKSNTMKRDHQDSDPIKLARKELDRLVFKKEDDRSDIFNDTIDFALTPNSIIIFASFFAADSGAESGGKKVRSFSYDSLADKLGITRSGVKSALARLTECDMMTLKSVEVKGRAVAFKPLLTEFVKENCREEYLKLGE